MAAPFGLEYKSAALAAPGVECKTALADLGAASSGTVLATTDTPANAWQRKSPEFDLTGDPDGTAWLIVAVTGVRDEVNDVIVPGAFRRTLAERPLKGVKGHDWNRRTAVQRRAMELLPGDPRLPDTLADGVTPWPRDAGILLVKCAYLLDTEDGRTAWAEVKADGPNAAQSIGYKVTDGGAKIKAGIRHIYDLDCYEWSNVLHGAHPMANALAVKSDTVDWEAWAALPPAGVEGKARNLVRRVHDPAYWGRPVGTIITPGMRPVGPRYRAGARDRGGDQRAGQRGVGGGMGRAGLGGIRRDTAAAMRARETTPDKRSTNWRKAEKIGQQAADAVHKGDQDALAKLVDKHGRGTIDSGLHYHQSADQVRAALSALDDERDARLGVQHTEGMDRQVSRARHTSTGNVVDARANVAAAEKAERAKGYDADGNKLRNLSALADAKRPLLASENGRVAAMFRGKDDKGNDRGWAVFDTRTGAILAEGESTDDVHEFVESAAEVAEERDRDGGSAGRDGGAALPGVHAAGVRGDTGGQTGSVLRGVGGDGGAADSGDGGLAGRAGSAGGDVPAEGRAAGRGAADRGGDGTAGADSADAGGGAGGDGDTGGAGVGRRVAVVERSAGDGTGGDGGEVVSDATDDAGLAPDDVDEADLPQVDLQSAENLDRISGDPFQPRNMDDLAPAGVRAKLDANMAALRMLRNLQHDPNGRAATVDEQRVLARWAGWGGLPKVFDDQYAEYDAERRELRGLMSDSEWNEARKNTLNAHYTDARATAAVWQAMRDLGFDGGRVLEPGSGSGNFIGFAPDDTDMVGVELDSTTAGISKYLYPNATIRNESFAKTRLPDGSFDAVVGNVPFGKFPLHDPVHNKAGHTIHNHFILKSLAMTRPGGVVSLLTSRYTLDAMDSKAREEMAELGDLIGAVRLPTGSHQRASGTDVIEDILIFRRREPGAEPLTDQSWVKSSRVDVNGFKLPQNGYWADHPENILGETTAEKGQYGTGSIIVRGDRNMGGLSEALGRITADAKARGLTQSDRGEPLPDLIAADSSRHEGHVQREPDGTFTQANRGAAVPLAVPASAGKEVGELLSIRDQVQQLLRLESQSSADTPAIIAARVELNRQYDAYVKRYGPINRFKFTANGQRRQDTAQMWFRRDPSSAIVRALGNYDSTANGGKGAETKAAIFAKRSAAPRQIATTADNPADALALSMEAHGEVSLPAIAAALGVDEAEARGQLGNLVHEIPALSFDEEEAAVAWARATATGETDPLSAEEDPEGLAGARQAAGMRGDLVPAAEYLSGDVRRKLAAAQAMARVDPRFQANVAALERVVPRDLGPDEIDGRVGAAWVPPEIVTQFANELMNTRKITVSKAGTNWEVDGGTEGQLAVEQWGTEKRPFGKLLQGMLEQRPIKVTKKVKSGDGEKNVQDMDATLAAQAKADELNGRFAEWLWEDPDRARRLQANYNWQFNSLALRTYDVPVDADGKPLRQRVFPGMSAEFEPRAHQVSAVERIINEPTALLGHVVGAGKTAEMAIGAAELKRLGLARKPAIVVPNHMLEQITREYLEIYPQAKVLAAGTKDLEVVKDKDKNIVRDGRREFAARAATGDWDVVILTQKAFEKIPVSPEQQKEYMDRQLAEMRAALEAAKAADPDKERRSTKQMELAVQSAESALEKLLEKGEKDEGGVTFEQTGIDYLMVDEAHMYSNLRTVTRIQNAGADGSGMATDLHMKLEYLRANTESGRVATFATGTPIRNTVTQSYIMMKFLRPDLLQQAGVAEFDEWAATFGEVVEETELKPEGEGFRQTSRFAKFRNVPELLRMFHTFADIKLAEDLKLPTPNLVGGRTQTVVVPAPDGLPEYITWLAARAEAVRNGDVEPHEDNMLSVSMDGRKAALSMALVQEEHDRTSASARANTPTKEHQPGKLEAAADRIHSIYERNKDNIYPVNPKDPSAGDDPNRGGMQIVFLDLGTPQSEADKKKDGPRFDAYAHLRDELVARGMDRSRIRFMHEARNDAEKALLFAAARSGAIDVLVGSTEKMGVGTNVQKRAVALHHLDAPWRPADVEQRDGRIMRQGNLNPDVEVIRYVAEGSFDAYMWQTLERKARFINQIMKGSLDVREIEDVGDTAMSYAEVKALATGNMDLLTKAKTDALRIKLERLKRTHDRSQTNMKVEVGRLDVAADQAEADAEKLEAAAASYRDTRGDKFRLDDIYGGRTYADRGAAMTALKPRLQELRQELRRRRFYGEPTERVATLGGHTLLAEYQDDEIRGPVLALRFDGVPGTVITLTDEDLKAVGPGLALRLENFLAAMSGRAAGLRDRAEHNRVEIARMKARIGLAFPKERDLFAAQAKSRRLQEKMQLDALRKEQGLTPEQVRELPADSPLAWDPLIDTSVNDDPILGKDEDEVAAVDLPAEVEPPPPTVEAVPDAPSPQEVTSPAGEVVDSPEGITGPDIDAATMDAARADADAALVDGDRAALAGALEKMGVTADSGRDELADALMVLDEDTQHRRLDQIELLNAHDGAQAQVADNQRARAADRAARAAEGPPTELDADTVAAAEALDAPGTPTEIPAADVAAIAEPDMGDLANHTRPPELAAQDQARAAAEARARTLVGNAREAAENGEHDRAAMLIGRAQEATPHRADQLQSLRDGYQAQADANAGGDTTPTVAQAAAPAETEAPAAPRAARAPLVSPNLDSGFREREDPLPGGSTQDRVDEMARLRRELRHARTREQRTNIATDGRQRHLLDTLDAHQQHLDRIDPNQGGLFDDPDRQAPTLPPVDGPYAATVDTDSLARSIDRGNRVDTLDALDKLGYPGEAGEDQYTRLRTHPDGTHNGVQEMVADAQARSGYVDTSRDVPLEQTRGRDGGDVAQSMWESRPEHATDLAAGIDDSQVPDALSELEYLDRGEHTHAQAIEILRERQADLDEQMRREMRAEREAAQTEGRPASPQAIAALADGSIVDWLRTIEPLDTDTLMEVDAELTRPGAKPNAAHQAVRNILANRSREQDNGGVELSPADLDAAAGVGADVPDTPAAPEAPPRLAVLPTLGRYNNRADVASRLRSAVMGSRGVTPERRQALVVMANWLDGPRTADAPEPFIPGDVDREGVAAEIDGFADEWATHDEAAWLKGPTGAPLPDDLHAMAAAARSNVAGAERERFAAASSRASNNYWRDDPAELHAALGDMGSADPQADARFIAEGDPALNPIRRGNTADRLRAVADRLNPDTGGGRTAESPWTREPEPPAAPEDVTPDETIAAHAGGGVTGNQYAAEAYQAFHFDQNPTAALAAIDKAEQVDPGQADRWARLRQEYSPGGARDGLTSVPGYEGDGSAPQSHAIPDEAPPAPAPAEDTPPAPAEDAPSGDTPDTSPADTSAPDSAPDDTSPADTSAPDTQPFDLRLDGPMQMLVGDGIDGATVDGRTITVTDPDAAKAWLDNAEAEHDGRSGDKKRRRAAARLRTAIDDELADQSDERDQQAEPDAPDTAAPATGTSDAGTSDAGTSDAGTSDAGTPDTEGSDTGTAPDPNAPQESMFDDAPTTPDNGETSPDDTGTTDAGPSLAEQDGAPDGSVPADDGQGPSMAEQDGAPDTGTPDAGLPADQGLPPDQGGPVDETGAPLDPTADPTGTPVPGPDQAEIAADALAEAEQVESDALGVVVADDGEIEVTPDVAARQNRVESLLSRADAGQLDVSAEKDSDLSDNRRDLVDELRLQEALARRDLQRRREAAAARRDQQAQQQQQAADAAAMAGPDGAPDGAAVDEAGAPGAPTPPAAPIPQPEPTPKRRPGLAGSVEDLADAVEGGNPDEVMAALRRARTSLARSAGGTTQHDELAALLADEQTPLDPDRLRELATALRDNARSSRNARARARRLAKRIERDRLRSLVGQYDTELRHRGRTPEDFGGAVPTPGPSDAEIAAELGPDDPGPDVPNAGGPGVGGDPGSPAKQPAPDPNAGTGPDGSEPGAGQGAPAAPPSFDRADPDGPAGQARTTALVDGLVSQPWRLLGNPAVLLPGQDEAQDERRRAAARQAFADLIDQYGPAVRRRSNEDVDQAARQARAMARRRGDGDNADMAALTFALLLPKAQQRPYMAALRKAIGDYKRALAGRR